MVRRWFASLAPGLDVGAEVFDIVILRVTLAAALTATLTAPSLLSSGRAGFVAPCFADEGAPTSEPAPATEPAAGAITESGPTAAPSGVELDQSFLLLPSYDLETQSGQPQTIRVGDSITVHLQGDAQSLKNLPSGVALGWPQGTEDMTTSIAIDDKTSGDDRHFKITFIKAGKVTIPSLGLADAGGDAKKFVARTNPLTIEVASSIAKDDPKPKEAAPPLPPERLGFPMWTLVVAGILLLALMIAGIYGLVQWSKKRRLEEAKKPKGPPPTEDQVAMTALQKLEDQGLLKKGEFKRFYFGVSEILKHYIGARYKFDAVESTTDEMLDYLERQSGVQDRVLSTLKEMYERLDLVKFTDHVPVAIEGSELLDQARKIVSQTKRQIVLPSATGPTVSAGDKA